MNKLLSRIKAGYNITVTMPRWKHWIIYLIWAIAMIGYLSAMFLTPWFILLGFPFQILALSLSFKWNTNNT
jgi:hypothetical protein